MGVGGGLDRGRGCIAGLKRMVLGGGGLAVGGESTLEVVVDGGGSDSRELPETGKMVGWGHLHRWLGKREGGGEASSKPVEAEETMSQGLSQARVVR
uniref:DUF834 domain-containing protein n=1 Tax=Oryza punctata TaxID=4537 RepID=A0A0E0LAM2_ORYPU